MTDQRVEAYGKMLVDRCIGVKPGWQVVVDSTPLARPLLEVIARHIAERDAYFIPRISLDGLNSLWLATAPLPRVAETPSAMRAMFEQCDALIAIVAPENLREASMVPDDRRSLAAKAGQALQKRLLDGSMPWVGCQFPTPALAQDAGMSRYAFEDFLFGACLLDWEAEGRKMTAIKERFDRTNLVRIVGPGTDLTLSLKERLGGVDDGRVNMPGGEVFYSPVEDSANGVITYGEFPAVFFGTEVAGARLRFEHGVVVEATANAGEAFLRAMLDTDAGARRLGELGIGCNPRITRHMKNTLFDEKIFGTVHLAIGTGFPHLGGTNESAMHWDMVKDLRNGGVLYCDGELVQQDGKWVGLNMD